MAKKIFFPRDDESYFSVKEGHSLLITIVCLRFHPIKMKRLGYLTVLLKTFRGHWPDSVMSGFRGDTTVGESDEIVLAFALSRSN